MKLKDNILTENAWGDIRPVVQHCAWALDEKLRKNDHKTSFKNDSYVTLVAKLSEELRELRASIFYDEGGDIDDEAVDVANFALMIWVKKNETG